MHLTLLWPHIIPELELRAFAASSGPGGQHVNKVATAVMLRWNVAQSTTLPEDIKARLQALAGRKLSGEGVLVLTSACFASQERNREDVLAKLKELLEQSLKRPRKRKATKPTYASKQKRLEGKKKSSTTKALRARVKV